MEPDLDRAEALLDLGRYADAERMIRSHLAGNAESAHALRMLTSVLLHQDRDREAVDAGRRAVAVDPEDARGHVLLASGLAAIDEQNEAVHVAREATRLAPYDWSTHYTLGLALRSGRRPRSRQALACANEAIRLAPHQTHAHNLAGLCLDDLKQVKESDRAFREALRLDPANAIALNNLAGNAIDGGRLADASKMLTSALSIDAQRQMLHQNYDILLLRLIRRLYLALAALGAVLVVMVLAETPYPFRVSVVVLLLGCYAAATRRVVRHLPRGSHLWARGLIRRVDFAQRALVVGFVLLSVGVVVTGVAPRSIAVGSAIAMLTVLRMVGIAALIGAVIGLFRRSSRRG